jgi:hypothetical protein
MAIIWFHQTQPLYACREICESIGETAYSIQVLYLCMWLAHQWRKKYLCKPVGFVSVFVSSHIILKYSSCFVFVTHCLRLFLCASNDWHYWHLCHFATSLAAKGGWFLYIIYYKDSYSRKYSIRYLHRLQLWLRIKNGLCTGESLTSSYIWIFCWLF